MSKLSHLSLSPHSDSGPSFDCEIDVKFQTQPDDILSIKYVVTGEVDQLLIPEWKSPTLADGLWKKTCFEVFIESELGYCEFNFSPSGEWAVYAFYDYRSPMDWYASKLKAPKVGVLRTDRMLELNVRACTNGLPNSQRLIPCRLGISAVLEDLDGELSYWALKHPPGKPDFHHPLGFDAWLSE